MRVLLMTSLSCVSALLPGVVGAPVTHEQSEVQTPNAQISDRFTEIGLIGRKMDENLAEEDTGHLTGRFRGEAPDQRIPDSSGCILA
ncbi:hypothetical protein B0H16DRAFT_1551071 [Mycena metata]|uniref:RxLR effector candidate protein n=1 Tax=Mycena metata TaxID=1033252 RepID=A0AAD7IVP7_9AGAR|nr:hypothetical protein B0H16DRAFT_1551071 [Mycena metata]